MTKIELSPQPRILVIALRRLGDVLLTTPLIRSLRRAWPDAIIDALVFADTAGILAGNPDLDAIVPMPKSPSVAQALALGTGLFRRYDLAITTQPGDRPTLFAILAGRRRAGISDDNANGAIKRAFLHRVTPHDDSIHRVEQFLRIADCLGIARASEVIAPAARDDSAAPAGNYAVIHAAPMFRYKEWTKSGWREIAAQLIKRGLQVIATGGPDEGERRYLDEVWQGAQVRRVDGQLDWPRLAAVLSKARVYVGPDTSVTHLAAAVGCPTIALYGPTDPRLWGPWPKGGLASDWAAMGSIQRRGNVWLVQHAFPCTPCQLEGCERRLDSYSACLDELAPLQVIRATEQALAATVE